MLCEQIDAAAMERHRRRVRQFESVPDVKLKDLVLRRWIAAVGLKHHVDRRESPTACVAHQRAKLQHQRGPRHAQRVGSSTQRALRYRWASHNFVQHPGGVDLALQHRAAAGMRVVLCTEPVKQPDNLVAAKVGGIAHRWPPIAVAN